MSPEIGGGAFQDSSEDVFGSFDMINSITGMSHCVDGTHEMAVDVENVNSALPQDGREAKLLQRSASVIMMAIATVSRGTDV